MSNLVESAKQAAVAAAAAVVEPHPSGDETLAQIRPSVQRMVDEQVAQQVSSRMEVALNSELTEKLLDSMLQHERLATVLKQKVEDRTPRQYYSMVS